MASSDSVDQQLRSAAKLFGRERPLHQVLGGGKFADIVMWRDKRLSAVLLVAGTLVWFLFEVAEYNLLTLLCHISIAGMLVLFIWSNLAALMDGSPPKIPELIISEDVFKQLALAFHVKFHKFLSVLHGIACGKDLKHFIMAIGSLWILSVIGSCCSSLTLLYFGFLCIQVLPALYEHYEHEVDHLAAKGSQDLKKLYKKLDSKVLSKIPKGQTVKKD